MKVQQDIQSNNRFIPATDWNKYHPWPVIGGMRHLIFHEKTNGFHKVIVRIGRRVLIDEQAFFEWIKKQKEEQS